MFDITRLKFIRLNLELTQHDLAKQSGLSQSIITKIERGEIDPSYSSVKKIEEAILLLSTKKEAIAEKLMTKKIFSITRETSTKEIIKLFQTQNISQVPVIEQGIAIGLVTESSIIEKGANKRIAKEVMIEPPPIVPSHTTQSVLAGILKQYPLILIVKNNSFVGVITKADLLRSIMQNE